MTTSTLVERYQSDVQSWHEALSNGIIDSFQHDKQIEQLDMKLFEDLSIVKDFAIFDDELAVLLS